MSRGSRLPASLPVSGLADEMIPLLQRKLGLGGGGVSMPPAPASPLLAFAAGLDQTDGDVAEPQGAYRQLVTFGVGTEEYGVPIERVQEILRVTAITRVPGAPGLVRGVVNVRGRLLAVVDMKSRLGLGPADLGPESRVVMVDYGGRFVGLMVDRVSYVLKVPAAAIEPSPTSTLVSGVAYHEGRTLLVIDVDRALDAAEDSA